MTGTAGRAGRLLPRSLRPAARRALLWYRFRGLHGSDVLLVSYPKSGSTWLRFLLFQILTGREPDFDAVRAQLPPVGAHQGAPRLINQRGRLVRTHEPLQPYRGARGEPVIYLVRNGFDVLLSYADHIRREGGDVRDLDRFAAAFERGDVANYGPWHEHVLAAYTAARSEGMPFLVVRYEDLRSDPSAELHRVLSFVDVSADDEVVATAIAANSKEKMQAKEAESAHLQRRNLDGTTFVRSDRRASVDELLTTATVDRLRRTFAPALAAAGYDS